MFFNSLSFVCFFFPLVAALFFAIRKFSATAARLWIIAASAAFYAYGDPAGVPLLAASVAINFLIGRKLSRTGDPALPKDKKPLVLGLTLNIACLAFFKYTHVLIPPMGKLFFPLALSFYTFSQIAYLVELYQEKIAQPKFLDYLFYVLFFPKLVAGPIARPSEFLHQIRAARSAEWLSEHRWKGAAFFIIGLFKKACIADSLSPYTDRVFDLANVGGTIGFYQAWCGVFSYGLQLYFDFSGYTDMAIGAALMVGIILPPNFDAPYRAASITEFWRKWHMSLSYFFRDYLYVFLGGNRRGEARRYANVFIVMILCGMWHGSGFQFVAWGALHGFFIMVHTMWSNMKKISGWQFVRYEKQRMIVSSLFTFFCVMLAWIPFRAASIHAAWRLLGVMANFPTRWMNEGEFYLLMITVIPMLIIVWLFPTSQKWLRYEGVPEGERGTEIAVTQTLPLPWTAWRINMFWGICMGCMAAVSLISIAGGARFIYAGF